MIALPRIACPTLATLLLLVIAGSARADTAADIQKINGLLRRSQANLDSVNSSIGHLTSPPKGSAAKLAKSRMDQAYTDLEAAGKLVKALPNDGEGVSEVVTNYNNAVELYSKLQKILTGNSADEPPEKQDGEVKLGYPHADNFKNALFTYANKVEAPANQLTQMHAEMVAVADQLSINHRTTNQAMAMIAEARRQAGFVNEALAKIPANGEGVAAAKQKTRRVAQTSRRHGKVHKATAHRTHGHD